MKASKYIGNELEIFEKATNWKKYYGSILAPFLKGKVLEVGAGIGGTTKELCNGTQEKWVCLEPDHDLYSKLENKIKEGLLPKCCFCLEGTIEDLTRGDEFNTIIYIDVIEHIEKDTEELVRAKAILAEGGFLVVLVPAHKFLYNKFDEAIGHYRRYNKKMLYAVVPEGMQLLAMRYLDSCGLMASLMNKYFLKQDYPTVEQIELWNRLIVPISKFTDLILNYNVGKTLVAIWQKK